eukprot:CAMPEP_0171353854 /NCGR_PEP_ID=MMETSP0878-20121228/44407_1 /TAXON_ID=67004 /ORGANISM="Thalassiosira weissflogii, Strain CCMP1336" /LENGTH=732 /DNA_ID=CAMNT_0011859811 /DNA_START=23 /DNA_END=2219 /DNA_ORIENTATION=+
MSHSYASSSTTTTASTAQPLSDVLPWGSPLAVDAPAAFATRGSASSSSPSLDDDRPSILRTRRRARTLLVTDGISADGRFVLHSLALQFLSSRAVRRSSPSSDDRRTKSAEEGSVLWIGGGPLAESQICGGLRKGMAVRLGGTGGGSGGGERSLDREECDDTNGNDGATTTMGKLHVIAVPLELADAALLECSDDDDDDDDDAAKEFSHERYLKGLHRRIVHWLYRRELLSVEAASAATAAKSTRRHPTQQQQKNQQQDIYTTTNNTATRHIQSHPSSSSYMGPNLVIIDNLSVFSSLFGDVLTHAFLTNVRAALKRHAKRSVIMDDVGFDNHKQDGMSTATPTNNHTNETITTITTTNLLAVRCTSPDDGGLYHLDYDDDDLDIGSESGRGSHAPFVKGERLDPNTPGCCVGSGFGAERGRGSHAPSVKGERLRSDHTTLLRPWWGSGCGGGRGGNGLLGGIPDGVAGTTSYSLESGTDVSMGGTIASPHLTICHLEEQSLNLSLFPSANINGVGRPFHAPWLSQWHSTSTSTSLLQKLEDDLDIGSERGRGSHAPSVKGERLRSEHARLLRPWWGMGSGFGGGGGGNALIRGIPDGVAGTTSYSSESGTNVPMGGTIASPHSTICHLEERSHNLSLFPSADIGGVGGPFHAPLSSQWHSTSTSTSLLHKIGMYEYSDGIVDVSPLESGYARDILGRISFTSVWGGRGWWGRGDEFGGAGGDGIGLGIGIG